MVLGPVIGGGLGAAAGALLGSLIFSQDRPTSYKHITEAADKDDNIRTPAVANVNDEMRGLMPMTPEWTSWPDYDRWVMINRLVRLMWPKLTAAILDQVISGVKPVLHASLASVGVVEDVALGDEGMLGANHLHSHLLGKEFHLGSVPARIAAMKVYQNAEELCILELPMLWGSDVKLDVQVFLKIGPLRLIVPLQLSDLQFKMLARITLEPLVDTIPCIGGATVSLLETPHFDAKLRLLGGVDIMALPGIKDGVRFIVQSVFKQLALYPNSISVPLMPNYGLPAMPLGILHIRLQRIERFKSSDILTKGDAYVVFEVREGRGQRSKTIANCKDPTFNEEFFLVIDDLKTQTLRIKVFDEDIGADELVGAAELQFSTERIATDPKTGGQSVEFEPVEWIKTPMVEKAVVMPMHAPDSLLGGGLLGSALGGVASVAKAAANTAASAASAASQLALGGGSTRNGSYDDGTVPIKVAKSLKQLRAEVEAAERRRIAAEAAAAVAEKAKARAAAKQAAEQAGLPAPVEEVEEEVEAADEEPPAPPPKLTRAQKKAAAAATKAAAEEVKRKAAFEADTFVLAEELVKLRGNCVVPAGAKPTGTLFMTLTFMPFARPQYDDDIEMRPVKSGLAAVVPFDPPPAREIATNISDFQKGLLSVSIIRATALGAGGAKSKKSSVDPYVQLVLADCDPARPDETQYSGIRCNDNSPRWNETFDFTMVSAGSMLTINLFDKTGISDMVLSLKIKGRMQDVPLGRVQIPVADVVRNGKLRDTWALQDAESGTIEMRLVWSNIYVDDYM